MRRILWILLVLGAPAAAAESTLFSLQERDLDGTAYAIGPAGGSVDINSALSIKIDKNALRERLDRAQPDGGSSRLAAQVEQVRVMQQAVQAGISALEGFRGALRQWKAARQDSERDPHSAAQLASATQALNAATQNLARASLIVLDRALIIPELRSAINKRVDSLERVTTEQRHAIALEEAAAYSRRLAADVDRQLAAEGFRLQLGAWLVGVAGPTPVHLAGFDTLPEAEFYEVKRWQLAALLSPETQKQYQEARNAANAINSGQKDVWAVLREELVPDLSNTIAEHRVCLEKVDQSLGHVLGSASGEAAATLKKLQSAMQGYLSHVRELAGRYNNPALVADLPVFYTLLTSEIETLKRRTSELATLASDLADQLSKAAAAQRDAAKGVADAARQCQDRIVAQVNALSGTIRVLATLANSGRDIGAATLEFSDKVLKHDIASLPERAELDLRRTGKREAGDVLVMRFAFSVADRSPQLLEERRIRLYRIMSYVDVAVSLIFADPGKSTELKSRFQAAPSYSVLLKWGKRDSTFFNEIFQPGIGLNIAALDFNNDESLELGLGITLSAFRDYLQIGYGYNLNFGSSYWFVGLKFPMPDKAVETPKP